MRMSVRTSAASRVSGVPSSITTDKFSARFPIVAPNFNKFSFPELDRRFPGREVQISTPLEEDSEVALSNRLSLVATLKQVPGSVYQAAKLAVTTAYGIHQSHLIRLIDRPIVIDQKSSSERLELEKQIAGERAYSTRSLWRFEPEPMLVSQLSRLIGCFDDLLGSKPLRALFGRQELHFGSTLARLVPLVFSSGSSATFMKPMNISSKDCRPCFTRLAGSGL